MGISPGVCCDDTCRRVASWVPNGICVRRDRNLLCFSRGGSRTTDQRGDVIQRRHHDGRSDGLRRSVCSGGRIRRRGNRRLTARTTARQTSRRRLVSRRVYFRTRRRSARSPARTRSGSSIRPIPTRALSRTHPILETIPKAVRDTFPAASTPASPATVTPASSQAAEASSDVLTEGLGRHTTGRAPRVPPKVQGPYGRRASPARSQPRSGP